MTVPKPGPATSVTRLWSIARAQLTGYFAALDDVEIWLRESTVLVITGGPTADFNLCLVDDSAHVKEVFRLAAQRAHSRALPVTFMISNRAQQALGAEIEAMGLTHVGDAPLMTFSDASPTARGDYELVAARNPADMDHVARMVADAFAMDLPWVRRTFASDNLLDGSTAVTFYLAQQAGEPMSTVTVTGAGPVAGIWSMATPSDAQRRGAGRAALAGAMARSRALGASSFFLIATPAGKPLYDSVGFSTAETFPIYASGE